MTVDDRINKCRELRNKMNEAYKTGKETDGEALAKELHIYQLETLRDLEGNDKIKFISSGM